jgi:hypothetical protein
MATVVSGTYTSNADSSLKQSILDTITNIAPTDCVFYNSVGKGTAKAKLEEWEEDTLGAAATNAQLEGEDVTAVLVTYPTRVSNYTQLSYRVFKISDTMESVDKVGRASEIAYQTGRYMSMLKRDMEYDMLNTAASAAGDATGTARSSNGVKGFITTNLYSFGNVAAVTNLLTETLFEDQMANCWTLGGDPTLVLAPIAQKRRIAEFNGNNKITVNTDDSDRKIINSVDVYEGSAGTVSVKASRFIAEDHSGYESIFFLQKDMWDILFLSKIKSEKLARLGPATTVLVSAQYTLRCKSQKANAWISHLYNA